ncbi:glutamate--tRNA ligase, partial [Fusobacterium animalis ATCC 51191]
NIENIKVSQKALDDNYDKDREAFSLVEVALFMKSAYSNGVEAKKLTDKDYEELQKRFIDTNKFKQLEQYMEIQDKKY